MGPGSESSVVTQFDEQCCLVAGTALLHELFFKKVSVLVGLGYIFCTLHIVLIGLNIIFEQMSVLTNTTSVMNNSPWFHQLLSVMTRYSSKNISKYNICTVLIHGQIGIDIEGTMFLKYGNTLASLQSVYNKATIYSRLHHSDNKFTDIMFTDVY